MQLLNLDPEKLLIIMAVALIVLGPNELPRVARELGRWMRVVQELRSRVQAEVATFADSVVSASGAEPPSDERPSASDPTTDAQIGPASES